MILVNLLMRCCQLYPTCSSLMLYYPMHTQKLCTYWTHDGPWCTSCSTYIRCFTIENRVIGWTPSRATHSWRLNNPHHTVPVPMVIIWASIKCSRTTTQYIHDKPTSLTWRHTLRCKLFCHPQVPPNKSKQLWIPLKAQLEDFDIVDHALECEQRWMTLASNTSSTTSAPAMCFTTLGSSPQDGVHNSTSKLSQWVRKWVSVLVLHLYLAAALIKHSSRLSFLLTMKVLWFGVQVIT
jgi:hypothetical protein